MKIIKNIVIIIYRKWVKGDCRHFCMFCDFRNNCFDNYEMLD